MDTSSKNNSPLKIAEGVWGNIPWQFFTEVNEPNPKLCTAAFCIVTYKGKIVLVEHVSRGFEFAGGHIDLAEDILTTVTREVLEESLAVIKEPQFFGYKKISPHKPITHRDNRNKFYPFPHSYIPYYFAEAKEFSKERELAADIKSVRLASYDEAFILLQPGHAHDKILEYLITKKKIFS